MARKNQVKFVLKIYFQDLSSSLSYILVECFLAEPHLLAKFHINRRLHRRVVNHYKQHFF